MRPKKDNPGAGKKRKPAVKSPFEKFFIKKNKEEETELPTQRRRRSAPDKDESRPERKPGKDDSRPGRSPRRDDARPERSPRRDDDRPERSPRRDDDRPERSPRRDDSRPERSPRRDDSRPERSPRRDDSRPERSPRRDDSRPERSPRRDDSRSERTPRRDDSRSERSPRRDDSRPERSLRRDDSRSERSPRRDDSRPERSSRGGEGRGGKSPFGGERKRADFGPKREFKPRDREERPGSDRKPRLFDENFFNRPRDFEREEEETAEPKERFADVKKAVDKNEIIRLNKFIAQSGICSRRKAAEMVKAGEIMVNGEVNTNPAYETQEHDIITYKGEVVKKEEKLIYVLLNKPKNFITTAEDEKGRKTVLDLVKDRYTERLFPVGRLDRNTTGLILLTNDGALAKKLSHPSHQIKKIYHVELDKNLKTSDLDKIKEGIQLEDGPAEVDAVDYIESGKKNEVGIEIHSGKNRIVRRIFESLGYEVVKLDRTYFAGLTKKDLPRGFSRELIEKEIIMLRHFTNRRKES
ncbi:MAG: pseudouridine synthase [Saprospiraceae bacterium]|nr:pseudouridine synthase [Saprospiraceae bacterium]